ncbi:hypothetical protein [Nonlabens agnitus]|uniref:Uncharacterized protein n=1 Tax=Nonlabens agnitus TaxID=870484 RepID=A0A2S9WWB2_9FLAO|nr:hypothetical protein [Nonlabens agnitus]PRP67753.1 hypothetical protein BST86_11940 [Nonlabens agnitus]
MNYTFDPQEKAIIDTLENSNPERIWTQFIKIVIEFKDYYVELECIPEVADSQNDADEAMTVKIRKFENTYEPCKHAKVIVENQSILEIKRVRTLLYFTDSITDPVETKKIDSQWNKILSKISGLRRSRIDKMFESGSSSYHDEIICNPKAPQAQVIKKEFSNLIDVGLLLKVKDKFVPAFLLSNAYGFNHLERKALYTMEELKEGLHNYELL